MAQRVGGYGLVARMVELFEQSTADRAAHMARALLTNDRMQVSKIAHAYRGSAAQVGAEPLRAAAEALEREAVDLGRQHLEVRVAEVMDLATAASASLNDYLNAMSR